MNSENTVVGYARKGLIDRSQLVAEDPKLEANNGGHGITGTLTTNLFQNSFGNWNAKFKKFSTFMWDFQMVIGAGFKNIQWGIKTAKNYSAYRVGDFLQLFIDNRIKVYESRIGDLQVKLQVSLDFPPNGHVDKFKDPNDYFQFIELYSSKLAESMNFTMYQLIRGMFISSAFNLCLPSDKYGKFMMETLSQVRRTETETYETNPILGIIQNHGSTLKSLCDEFNKKITNCYVFDVGDFVGPIPERHAFNPYNPGAPHLKNKRMVEGKMEETSKKQLLLNCLTASGLASIGHSDSDQKPVYQYSREQSLKAFELVLGKIAMDIVTSDPKPTGGQGNKGNVRSEKVWSQEEDDVNDVYINPKGDTFPSTTILNKKFNKRPVLFVESTKENLVLIIGQSDYQDFMSGAYLGGVGENSLFGIRFKDFVGNLFSEIIQIPGMAPGHAIIMDRRMFAIIPHLQANGTDTLTQRLASVETIHNWFIFGMFDQFVGVRIQMVEYTPNPIAGYELFYDYRSEEPSR